MILEDLISFRNKLVHGEKVDQNLIVERFKDIINVFKNLTFLLSWKICVRVNKNILYIRKFAKSRKVYNGATKYTVIDNDIKNYVIISLLHFNIYLNKLMLLNYFFLIQEVLIN